MNDTNLDDGLSEGLAATTEVVTLLPPELDENGKAADEKQRAAIGQRAHKVLVEKVGFDPEDNIPDTNILTGGIGQPEHNHISWKEGEVRISGM